MSLSECFRFPHESNLFILYISIFSCMNKMSFQRFAFLKGSPVRGDLTDYKSVYSSAMRASLQVLRKILASQYCCSLVISKISYKIINIIIFQIMAESGNSEAPQTHTHGDGQHHDHHNYSTRHVKDNHDHEHDHHDHHEDQHDEPFDPKSNRGEKKFKKAMTKMGLNPVTGINRVTIKKGKAFVISIDDPDVWKTPGNESSYIIFGKPNMDGLQTGQNEIDQFKNPVVPEGAQEPKTESPVAQEAGTTAVEQPAEDLNEEGLTPENIKMVIEYTKCTRAEAIKVLRETDNDSVNAIMKLTK